MPKPTEVNPKNFSVETILYDEEGFSIARGIWVEDGSVRLAMRWNGTGDNAGYPKLFKNPVWFVLPPSLTERLSKALI